MSNNSELESLKSEIESTSKVNKISINTNTISDLKTLLEYLDEKKDEFTSTPSASFEALYKDFYDSPLNEPLAVRMLTVNEDKQLISQPDLQDRLIKALELSVVTQSGKRLTKQEIDELYSAEVEYMYLMYRIHNFGPMYRFEYDCSRCSKHNHGSVNLSKLKSNKPTSISKVVHLPLSDLSVEIVPATIKMIKRVAKYMENYARDNNLSPTEKLIESNLTSNAMSIKTIGDVDVFNQLDITRSIISKLPAQDMIVIDNAFDEFNKVGVDFTTECTCSHCHHSEVVTIPFSWEFFRPTTNADE